MKRPAIDTSVQPGAGPAGGAGAGVAVRRIRFVERPVAGATVRREFRHPHRCVALEEPLAAAELPRERPWPEPTDQLLVVLVPKAAAAEWQKAGAGWLAPPDQPEAAPLAAVAWEGIQVQWRPGRAVVQARPERFEEALAALTDFAYYEGELRALERALEVREAEAQADVPRAYRITRADRSHWDRLAAIMEALARMRLSYARLEPCLAGGSRSLPTASRRLVRRLLARADVAARLEALSDRLEACEDLYEGANDRVADYRGWARGHLMEIAIVLFLLLEVVIMGLELYLRYLELFVLE